MKHESTQRVLAGAFGSFVGTKEQNVKKEWKKKRKREYNDKKRFLIL